VTIGHRLLGEARTRAEEVRARRASQARQMEPLADMPKRRKASRKRQPRRRYDLALPIELGAEIRLPAIPALKAGPRLVSSLVLALLGLVLRGLLTAPQFFVAEAAIEGNDLLTANQVRSIAQADEMPVFLVDPAESVARFAPVAEVAAASVQVSWPNRTSVTIMERQPLVAWKDGFRDWWLSEEGVAFLKHGEREGLVHITSETPILNIQRDPLAQVIDPQVLVAAGVLAAQLPSVESFVYDPILGLGYQDARGWTAYFGVDGDMVMKVRLYTAIVEHLESKSITPATISVKDPSAPFYRQ